MAGLSDYLEAKLLDHVLQGGALTYTPPSTLYVALHTANPDDDGFGFEFVGMSYTRLPITFTTSGSGNIANTAPVVWTNLPGLQVAWIVVWDAESLGNPLFIGEVTDVNGNPTPKQLNSGDSFTINTSDLDIALD